jgi:hypothetical protein
MTPLTGRLRLSGIIRRRSDAGPKRYAARHPLNAAIRVDPAAEVVTVCDRLDRGGTQAGGRFEVAPKLASYAVRRIMARTREIWP